MAGIAPRPVAYWIAAVLTPGARVMCRACARPIDRCALAGKGQAHGNGRT